MDAHWIKQFWFQGENIFKGNMQIELYDLKNENTKMQKALEGVNSIEEVAINLKTIAQDFDGYTLEQGNIAGTNDNILKGFFSSTAVKTMAGPIRGTQGVYAFIITEKTVSNDEKIEDAKKNLSQEPKMSAKQWTESTLKKILDVKDTRYKFYN